MAAVRSDRWQWQWQWQARVVVNGNRIGVGGRDGNGKTDKRWLRKGLPSESDSDRADGETGDAD
jgi:hypothetical protein